MADFPLGDRRKRGTADDWAGCLGLTWTLHWASAGTQVVVAAVDTAAVVVGHRLAVGIVADSVHTVLKVAVVVVGAYTGSAVDTGPGSWAPSALAHH